MPVKREQVDAATGQVELAELLRKAGPVLAAPQAVRPGTLGLDDVRVLVSGTFTARTDAGKAVYELHGRTLRGRPGTALPAPAHVGWHRAEVFKGNALAA